MTARSAFAGIALAALLAAPQARANAPAAAPAAQPATHPREASLDEYRSHLQALAAIVEACAKARDLSLIHISSTASLSRFSTMTSASARRVSISSG